ncbi:MAG TPA: glycosyltransferase [Pseudonocardia sp.]|jgi:glycosyltransferase involved in cell wall biosynthesis|nr:glycosyltransferase [Pseudonocardia sp.]
MSEVAAGTMVRAGGQPPATIDRLLVQQFDISRAVTIGGIDTCIRGLLEYAPPGVDLAIVGVDDRSTSDHELGRWETHIRGGHTVHFLPVARVDTSRPNRRIPHSVRLIAGLLRHRAAIPRPTLVQAHRLDVAMAVRLLFRVPLIYCIHTQQHGLIGRTSDSFWRFAGGSLYERLDRMMARVARRVIVFNPDYAEHVRTWNPRTVSAPTWFDPANTPFRPESPDPYAVVWVGRLEVPKDPELAVRAFAHLAETHPDEPWTLDVVGSGTLLPDLERRIAGLPTAVAGRIRLLGRLSPRELAEVRGRSGVFLMTSHPGYEGFPRVLVEALATGLPAVVTEGSDTGRLVRPEVSGSVHGRDPAALAEGIRAARSLDRTGIAGVVSALSAPEVVREVFFGDDARFGTPVGRQV